MVAGGRRGRRERENPAMADKRSGDRRAGAEGRPAYFDEGGTSFHALTDPAEDPTVAIRLDALETRQFSVADGDALVPGEPPRRRLAVSTAIFSAATALSRVLGLAREMLAS